MPNTGAIASALDAKNEILCYDALRNHCRLWISVGHRESLKPFHKKVLELQEGGRYSVRDL